MADIEPRLLRAFLAIFAAGSVSGAARAQGVSQPTMSEHLRRLRAHFSDRLFIFSPRGMTVTPRAESVLPVAERLIVDLEALAVRYVKFDARSVKRRFHILASDYVQALMLPGIDARLRANAPGIRLHLEPASVHGNPETVDLAIWPAFAAPRHQRVRPLFNDRLVCVFDPTIVNSESMNLQTFCRLEHVLFAPAPSPLHSAVDEALATIGLQRRIGPIVGQVASLPDLLLGLERLAILPSRLVESAVPCLTVAAIPVALEPIRMVMTWPTALDQDAAHQWLRDAIATVAAAIR
jgi:DNA-binding transcriptional LysR family regulator